MAKTKPPYMGVFENMDFPDYKFEEYPKVVGYRDEKKTDPIIVNDAREEVEFITKGAPGAHISREEELQAEADRNAKLLAAAQEELKKLKAAQAEKVAAASPPAKGA